MSNRMQIYIYTVLKNTVESLSHVSIVKLSSDPSSFETSIHIVGRWYKAANKYANGIH